MSPDAVFQVSGYYRISQGDSPSPPTLIEHCCLMTSGNKWNIDVKCRPLKLSHVKGASHQTDSWRSLKEAYPDAKIKHKHNDIEVTLPSLQEDIEIAAFGRPGKDDQKRMQMATFGGKALHGRNWKIWVYLVDDTTTAYKQVCKKEERRGHQLLQPLAGMFVANSNEDIRIELSALEPEWKINGSTVKTIKSEDAWNSPENSTDFPNCHFEISHVDKRKQSFFCVITASHGKDSAIAEIVEYFERERSQKLIQPSKNVPKESNLSQPYCSQGTSGWLPTLLLFFSFLFPPNCQMSGQKGTINTYHDQHFLTRNAVPTETHKKLMFAVFQNHRLKETN